MSRPKKNSVDRRSFLRGAAAMMAGAGAAGAQQSTPAAQKETDLSSSSTAEVLTTERPGSDFMVDVIKSLGFEYIASNPGSSFRALHESIINYGGNKSPELLTCCHE